MLLNFVGGFGWGLSWPHAVCRKTFLTVVVSLVTVDEWFVCRRLIAAFGFNFLLNNSLVSSSAAHFVLYLDVGCLD